MRPHENVVMLKGVCLNPYAIVTGLASIGSTDPSEFVPNGSLKVYLEKHELDIQQAISVIYGIAKGVHHLHCENIGTKKCHSLTQEVHRDLAVRNVLVTESMVPKITDFGSPRIIPKRFAGCHDSA